MVQLPQQISHGRIDKCALDSERKFKRSHCGDSFAFDGSHMANEMWPIAAETANVSEVKGCMGSGMGRCRGLGPLHLLSKSQVSPNPPHPPH